MRRISFGARTYNASIGRFDGVDPLAFAFGDISPYSYVLNSPLIYMDPFGDSTVHVNKLDWQKFNPEKDDILLDAATVTSRRYYEYGSNPVFSDFPSGVSKADLNVERPIYNPRGPYTKEQMYQRSGTVEPNYFIESSFVLKFPSFSLSWLAKLFRFKKASSIAGKGVTSLVTKYPAVGEIAGTTERTYLMPGQIIDRYGPMGGKWFSTPSTTYGARSIPPGLSPYTQFKVLKPFEVQKSLASPGMFSGQSGFGVQFQSPVGAYILIKRGIIEPF